MISETRYILVHPDVDEGRFLDELTGFGFQDESEAREAAFFGADLAPSARMMKVTAYIEEVK